MKQLRYYMPRTRFALGNEPVSHDIKKDAVAMVNKHVQVIPGVKIGVQTTEAGDASVAIQKVAAKPEVVQPVSVPAQQAEPTDQMSTPGGNVNNEKILGMPKNKAILAGGAILAALLLVR